MAVVRVELPQEIIKERPMEFEGVVFYRVNTCADGHCLAHALLYLTSANYRKLKTQKEKTLAAVALRLLAADFVKDNSKVFEKIEQMTPGEKEFTQDALINHLASGDYLQNGYPLAAFSLLLKRNIYVINPENLEANWSGYEPLGANKNWPTIFVYYDNEDDKEHFEALLFKTDDGKCQDVKLASSVMSAETAEEKGFTLYYDEDEDYESGDEDYESGDE